MKKFSGFWFKILFPNLTRIFVLLLFKKQKHNHFGVDLDKLELKTCFLQELTKYVLNILLCEIDYQELTELDLLYAKEMIVYI